MEDKVIELEKHIYAELVQSVPPEDRFTQDDGMSLVLFTPRNRKLIFKPQEELR